MNFFLKIALPAIMSFLLTVPAMASHWTSCDIDAGFAKGYVHTNDSLSLSGRVNFDMYDADGDLVASDWKIAVVVVVGADSEFVEKVRAPITAVRCTLDVSSATDDDSDGPSDPVVDERYTTSCEVRGGKAIGYVHTTESLSFSGRVKFKNFDRNLRLLSEDWVTVIVVVVGASNELVEEITAPTKSVLCSLDISEAVGDN
jgi:hypothetical protein